MEKDRKPGTSKQAKEKDDDRKPVPYSPTKYYSEMVQCETERIIKLAEAETRLEFYKNFKSAREEIVRKDPAVNQVHLRRLEEYQIDETAKRRQDVRAIEEKMREIDERSRKNRQKM